MATRISCAGPIHCCGNTNCRSRCISRPAFPIATVTCGTALETVIAQNSRVGMVVNGKDQYFESATIGEKRELYDAVYRYLLSMKTDEEIRRAVRDLCATYSLDLADLCHDECMDWSELSELAADPLCTIGAHTVNHMILKKVPSEKAVRAEMEMSRAVIEAA